MTATETAIRTLVTDGVPGTTVEEIRLIRDGKGKVKGFAYVQLAQESEVEQAVIALSKANLLGRSIKVERAKLKEQVLSKSANAVVVTNLSYSVRETALKAFLEKAFGAVSSVSLVTDDKGRSKGFAFVQFDA